MMTATWTLPATWLVPREWPDARCFILCSGESIGPQAAMIRQLQGRFIAVKHGVFVKPDADVLFVPGERTPAIALSLVKHFRGTYMVVRQKHDPALPETMHRVTRTKTHTELCELRDHVCGYDAGTSAINLAYHFGATEIVMLGYDMTGGHFCKHPLQNPPLDHFRRHMEPLVALNADALRKGVKIWNASPISKATAFEYRALETFL